MTFKLPSKTHTSVAKGGSNKPTQSNLKQAFIRPRPLLLLRTTEQHEPSSLSVNSWCASRHKSSFPKRAVHSTLSFLRTCPWVLTSMATHTQQFRARSHQSLCLCCTQHTSTFSQ